MPSFADPSGYELLPSCEHQGAVKPITHRHGAFTDPPPGIFSLLLELNFCTTRDTIYGPQVSGQERDYIDGLVEWPKQTSIKST